MDRLKDVPTNPEYKLPSLDYDELIGRLVNKDASFEYAIKLFHRAKLTSKESGARLEDSVQHARESFPATFEQHEVDLTSQKRRRGVFRSNGMIFPEARDALFLPPDSEERTAQIEAFTETMDCVTEHSSKIDPYKLAAWGYLHFIAIHPFSFGNGRAANEIANFTLRKMGENASLPRPLFSKDKKKWKNVLSAITKYMIDFNKTDSGYFSNLEEKWRHDWDVMLKYCQQVKSMPETGANFPQEELVNYLAGMFRDCAKPLA